MAKRSYRRPAQPQRGNVSCMWGLISLFDFRRGHPTQKLLSDKKHGSITHTGSGYSRVKLDSLQNIGNEVEGGTLGDAIRKDQINVGLTSVKALIEEEMSQHSQKKISSEVQRVNSNFLNEVHPKRSYKQRSKKLKLISDKQGESLDASSSFDGLQSDSMDLTERPSLNFDLAAFLIEFYSYTRQQMHADSNNKFDLLPASRIIGHWSPNHLDELDDHLDRKISFFQQTLTEVAQAIISQKSMAETQADGRWVAHPKEFMDTLDTLISDKELFLKLIKDPDSFLLEHIRNLQDTQARKISKLGSDRYLENVRLLSEESNSSRKCKESDSNQLLQKQKRYSFFWKKDKSKGAEPSKENPSSKALSRIVVLKPSPVGLPNSPVMVTPSSSPQAHNVGRHDENGERIVSHFSLKQIKRRLRHIIGESKKAQHVISMDGLLHKIPVRSSDTGDSSKLINSESAVPSLVANSSCDGKDFSESLSLDYTNDNKIHLEECEVKIDSHTFPSTSRSQSLLYEEAKKHLAEMLDTRVNNSPTVGVSESLGRVLSLPRYNELCSISSPQRDKKEIIMSPEDTGEPLVKHLQNEGETNNLGPARLKTEFPFCSLSIPDDEFKSPAFNTELVATNSLDLPHIREDLNKNGSTEIIEAVDTESIMVSNQLDAASESSKNKLIVVDNVHEEEAVTSLGLDSSEEKSPTVTPSLGLDSSEEKSPTVTPSKLPPCTLMRENLVDPESANEKHGEQPSPVSVLETFLSEDITSPESTTMENYGIQVQHQQDNYDERDNYVVITASPGIDDSSIDCLDDCQARFDYVKAVLEVSGLTNEFSERWYIEDHLIEPSLFDEIGIFFCFLQDDPKLLFDCINEVLVEIHERFLKCTPWVSIKHNVLPIPLGESLIQEVSKGLEWNLHIQLLITLDQVIGKDLECRSWMDLRFEVENITAEICDTILDDLMKESVHGS